MTLASQADFAASHGVSRKTATKWKQAGRLVLNGGKVDVEASDALLRDGRLGRFKDAEDKVTEDVTPAVTQGNARFSKVGNGAPRPPVVELDAPIDADEVIADLDAFVQRVLAGKFHTRAEAEKVKENALALKNVQAVLKEAGRVIDIEAAERTIFEYFRAERDSWMMWPSRMGPLIAADFNLPADKVVEVLTRHVHDHLAELGQQQPEFSAES